MMWSAFCKGVKVSFVTSLLISSSVYTNLGVSTTVLRGIEGCTYQSFLTGFSELIRQQVKIELTYKHF